MAKSYIDSKKTKNTVGPPKGKSYVENKKVKKKTATKAGWILILLAIVFIFVLVKFAKNAGMDFMSNTGLPSGDDAYAVAKEYVKATVVSKNVDFPGSGYQMAKKSDSVYVIRAAVQFTSPNGDKKMANYKVLMEYKGGKQDDEKNWALLNIIEE
jgi:hypothetical protein